jgi:hypothetical protein
VTYSPARVSQADFQIHVRCTILQQPDGFGNHQACCPRAHERHGSRFTGQLESAAIVLPEPGIARIFASDPRRASAPPLRSDLATTPPGSAHWAAYEADGVEDGRRLAEPAFDYTLKFRAAEVSARGVRIKTAEGKRRIVLLAPERVVEAAFDQPYSVSAPLHPYRAGTGFEAAAVGGGGDR